MAAKNVNIEKLAVLVDFSGSFFNNAKPDKAITAQVCEEKGLKQKAGRWTKYLLPPESIQPMRTIYGQARGMHLMMTSPWDDAARMLPTSQVEAYRSGFREYEKQFKAALSAFLVDYPGKWMDEAKEMHGPTFDESLYPLASEMKDYFHLSADFMPVPIGASFSKSIPARLLQILNTDLQAANKKRLNESMRDAARRLLQPITEMAEAMKEKRAYRKTHAQKIEKVLAVIPGLNIIDDPELSRATSDIQGLLNEVKEGNMKDETLILQVSEKASGIANQFKSLGKRKFC